MNKKFINLLLASVLTVGSAQVFTSCKDNEADLQDNFQFQYDKLDKKIDDNVERLDQVTEGLQDAVDGLQGQIDVIKDNLAGQIEDFNKELAEDLKEMGGSVDKLTNDLANYITQNNTDLANLKDSINNNFVTLTQLQAALEVLEPRVEALEKAKAIIEGRLDQVGDSINAHNGRISKLEGLATALGVKVDDLEKQYKELGLDVDTLKTNFKDLDSKLELTESSLTAAKEDIENLQIDLRDYKVATDGRLDALESFKNNWESILPEVQQNAADALAKAKANEASINAINTSIATITGNITDINGQITDINGNLVTITGDITKLQEDQIAQGLLIADIQEKLGSKVDVEDFNEAIKKLQEKDAELEALAMSNYAKSIGYTNLMIEQVLAQMAEKNLIIDGKLDVINADIVSIKEFQDGLNTEISKNSQAISELQSNIEDVNNKLTEISDELDTLIGRVDDIDGRITSIVLQGTEDDVFGSLRLPLGIQSNLLIGYLGEVANGGGEVEFPLVAETAGTYNGDISNTLTEEEARVLGVSNAPGARVPIETIRGLFMREAVNGNGYLGQVYATINPSSVNVQDPKFTYNLVNSRGEKVIEPMTFRPSDKELSFGYSRAANGNGFYSADATVKIDEASTNKIRFHFDDGLKNQVKEILKAPRAHANAQTVVSLGNAIYNQLNGFLPAIGVEASWTDSNNGEMKVTSNYAIATAVVNPLSFSFLYGVTPNKHIPHIMPAIDKIKDKFNVVFDEFANKLDIKLYDPENPFTVDGITLEAPHIVVNLNPSTAEPITIKVDPIEIDKVVSVNPDGTVNTVKEEVFAGYEQTIDIAGDINEMINDLKGNLEKEFAKIDKTFIDTNEKLEKLTTGIADQVNDLLQSMQTTVDTTIDDVISDIQNKVNGIFDNATLNKLVGRLDRVISKLNDMMDNANYYMQPVLLYNADGDFGMVSTSAAMPSVMVLNGDANAIVLKPTTYTYETVVPVYKKYVAVTKVWANGNPNDTYPSLALEANNNTGSNLNMNKVVSGSVRSIGLKLQKGYTYEVFYQAVDYSGYVSGRKYYICVK